METGGRMTRSRARALGAEASLTPVPASKATPAAKSTRGRRTQKKDTDAAIDTAEVKTLFAEPSNTSKEAQPHLADEPSSDLVAERSDDQVAAPEEAIVQDSTDAGDAADAEVPVSAVAPQPSPMVAAQQVAVSPMAVLPTAVFLSPINMSSDHVNMASPMLTQAVAGTLVGDIKPVAFEFAMPAAPMQSPVAITASAHSTSLDEQQVLQQLSPLAYEAAPPPLSHLSGIGFSPALSTHGMASASPMPIGADTPVASNTPAVMTGESGQTPVMFALPQSAQPTPLIFEMPAASAGDTPASAPGLTAYAGHTPPAATAFAGQTPATLEPAAPMPAPSPAPGVLSLASTPAATPSSVYVASLAPTPDVAQRTATAAINDAPTPGFAFAAMPAPMAASPTLLPSAAATPATAGVMLASTGMPLTPDDVAALEDEGLMELEQALEDMEGCVPVDDLEEALAEVGGEDEECNGQEYADLASTPIAAEAVETAIDGDLGAGDEEMGEQDSAVVAYEEDNTVPAAEEADAEVPAPQAAEGDDDMMDDAHAPTPGPAAAAPAPSPMRAGTATRTPKVVTPAATPAVPRSTLASRTPKATPNTTPGAPKASATPAAASKTPSAAAKTPVGRTTAMTPKSTVRATSTPQPMAVSPAPAAAVAGRTPLGSRTPPAKTPVATFKTPSVAFFGASVSKAQTHNTPAGATAATPAATATAGANTAAAKSTKRVSIIAAATAHSSTTPKGGPRPSFVTTPYPKSAGRSDSAPVEEEAGAACPAAIDADVPVAPQAVEVQEGEAAADAMMDDTDMQAAEPDAEAEVPAAEPKQAVQEDDVVLQAKADDAKHAARMEKAQAHLQRIHSADSGAAEAAVPSYMRGTAASSNRAAKLASKVVVPEGYDSRSLGQIRREIHAAAARKATKTAEAGAEASVDMTAMRTTKTVAPRDKAEREAAAVDEHGTSDEDDDQEAEYDQANEEVLMDAMSKLRIARPHATASGSDVPLRGVPVPQGRHTRFDDDGREQHSPKRVVLRGMPVASGAYKRWA